MREGGGEKNGHQGGGEVSQLRGRLKRLFHSETRVSNNKDTWNSLISFVCVCVSLSPPPLNSPRPDAWLSMFQVNWSWVSASSANASASLFLSCLSSSWVNMSIVDKNPLLQAKETNHYLFIVHWLMKHQRRQGDWQAKCKVNWRERNSTICLHLLCLLASPLVHSHLTCVPMILVVFTITSLLLSSPHLSHKVHCRCTANTRVTHKWKWIYDTIFSFVSPPSSLSTLFLAVSLPHSIIFSSTIIFLPSLTIGNRR